MCNTIVREGPGQRRVAVHPLLLQNSPGSQEICQTEMGTPIRMELSDKMLKETIETFHGVPRHY